MHLNVAVDTFNLAGPGLAVRPYCNNKHYWQVYFDTNRVIRKPSAKRAIPCRSTITTSAAAPERITLRINLSPA